MVFQTFIGLFEEGNTSEELIRVLVKLGKAFTKIRAWDDAIASLEKRLLIAESIEDESRGNTLKAAAKLSLVNTYLEKYASLPERKDELVSEALLLTEASRLQFSKLQRSCDSCLRS